MTTATEVRERPILFSAPMVRAVLSGAKTQTRRVVSKSNSDSCIRWDRLEFDDAKVQAGAPRTFADNGYLHVATRPHPEDPQDRVDYWTLNRVYPRDEVGDHLWVRETTWYRESDGITAYADGSIRTHPDAIFGDKLFTSNELPEPEWPGNAKSLGFKTVVSIHMPRRVSRLLLEITDIRVHRLQAISEEDAQAEGFGPGFVPCPHSEFPDMQTTRCIGFRPLFARRWDELNGNRGFTWESNPFVWVIEFRRLTP